MKRIRAQLFLAALLISAASAADFRRGVNLAGAEFGAGRLPGVVGQTHTYQSEASFQYFGRKKLNLIRFPVLWERWQPELNGPLDPANLKAFKEAVGWARKSGCSVIIDLHNYGRRRMKEDDGWKEYIIDREVNGEVKVPRAELNDFWRRVSREFKDEPAIWAYGLMNEPHDMGASDWKVISQGAVNAIRGNADGKLILVPGNGWSSAGGWPKNNGEKSWIVDPRHNFKYEAHCYFDKDNSGTYKKAYDDELAADAKLPTRGPERLAVFVNWCKTNNVDGFLGEFGVPNTDPRWSTVVLENFLTALDRAGLGGTYWAGGEFWGKYPLSVQPTDGFKKDAPQMETLLQHLGNPKEK